MSKTQIIFRYGCLTGWLGLALLQSSGALAACRPTEEDQLGPYYQPGAPITTALAGPAEPGERLVIPGRVLGMPDCKPLAGAIVDVWQANASGEYYRLQPAGESDANRFRLRGRIKTDAEGHYRFETVLPGYYEIGFGRSRPRHIHLMVSHPGYKTLITQLYFKGDKLLSHWASESPQVIELERGGPEGPAYRSTFDIVLSQ
jgi:protocatechuate 3,4-dioxygenase beta subunit